MGKHNGKRISLVNCSEKSLSPSSIPEIDNRSKCEVNSVSNSSFSEELREGSSSFKARISARRMICS